MKKDTESKLGDYGVRKYDSFTGRFITPDGDASLLFEKYAGWSPYHYSLDNPVSYKDFNGKDVYVLHDSEGADILSFIGVKPFAHSAVLIGPDENSKFHYYSKDGGALGISGNSKIGAGEYNSLEEFSKNNPRYEEAYKIDSDETKEDPIARKTAETSIESLYFAPGASCIDATSDVLKSIGKDPGYSIQNTWKSDRYGSYYQTSNKYLSPFPYIRYEKIKQNNHGETIQLGE